MAVVVGHFYRDIVRKYYEDHLKFPGRNKMLQNEIDEIKEELQFLRAAKDEAVFEKENAILDHADKSKQHLEKVAENKVKKERAIREMHSISDERIVIRSVRIHHHRKKSKGKNAFFRRFEHSLHALALQEGFEEIKRAVPGANLETVVTRLLTASQLKKKLHEKIDRQHHTQDLLLKNIKNLKEHLKNIKYGGSTRYMTLTKYSKELEEKTSTTQKKLQRTKMDLTFKMGLINSMKDHFNAILDRVHDTTCTRSLETPSMILAMFGGVRGHLNRLWDEVHEAHVKEEDFAIVRAPEFYKFVDKELTKQKRREWEKSMKGRFKRDSDDDKLAHHNYSNTSVDLEEFRQALKSNSIKLYLTKCKRNAKNNVREVPASMLTKYKPPEVIKKPPEKGKHEHQY